MLEAKEEEEASSHNQHPQKIQKKTKRDAIHKIKIPTIRSKVLTYYTKSEPFVAKNMN